MHEAKYVLCWPDLYCVLNKHRRIDGVSTGLVSCFYRRTDFSILSAAIERYPTTLRHMAGKLIVPYNKYTVSCNKSKIYCIYYVTYNVL